MSEAVKPKIVFVYNAESGVFNLAADIAHKIFSPQTYACNLCAITHSNFGMRKDWKTYLESLENPLEFLHADEFNSKYGIEKVSLPAVFVEDNGALREIADAARINKSRSIEDLKLIIDNELAEFSGK